MAMALPYCAMIGAPALKTKNVRNRYVTRRNLLVQACTVEKSVLEFGQKQQGLDSDSAADQNGGLYAKAMDSMPPGGFTVLVSCAVGLFTGLGVVAFNFSVHEIHDIVWEGVPRVTWFRSQPLSETWERIMLVPLGGGIVVGVINFIQSRLDGSMPDKIQAVSKSILKTLAAAVTLGTANSLGPEGPSVEIGATVGNGIGALFRSSREQTLSFVAAGSAAGISSGFNAAIAGCFFAVESVLRSSSMDSAPSVTTAMVLLSSVLASVVSRAGLGRDPAFKIPSYEFRSPSELPLYLLLGIICGVFSISLTRGSSYATAFFDKLQKSTGISPALLPAIGGICVGVIALAYPEVLYWGFENVDGVLESRAWAKGAPPDLLLQIVAAKVVATSLCRGSRLVGGVYAPSLFIGAALGSAYGKVVGYTVSNADPAYHLDTLINVAAPQAYALVGMAAMLASVCQVPFTAILLLFELTQDYRIILPLMAAVGLSSLVASSFATKSRPSNDVKFAQSPVEDVKQTDGLCDLESSLCVTNFDDTKIIKELTVSVAMRKEYPVVSTDSKVEDALALMLEYKDWFVLVVGIEGFLQGILTLTDIQEEVQKAPSTQVSRMKVLQICKRNLVTAEPEMRLEKARRLMAKRGLRQLPVLSKNGQVVGVIDEEAIKFACRLEATRMLLSSKQLN